MGGSCRVFIRSLTGYAQVTHKVGCSGLRRTQLTRSGFIAEYRVACRSTLLHMFGPSCPAALVKHWTTTMASADFCPITPGVSTWRAVLVRQTAASFFVTQRAARHGARFLVTRGEPSGSCLSSPAPHVRQISPGKNANCRCTSAAFTVGAVPLGFAFTGRLASTPSAFYAVSVRRLAPLALRLPSHIASRLCNCLRLVVIMLTMSPCRYSHRGLPPHKFAPMLGAPVGSTRTKMLRIFAG